MTDDLVRRLREYIGDGADQTCQEAADRIEALVDAREREKQMAQQARRSNEENRERAEKAEAELAAFQGKTRPAIPSDLVDALKQAEAENQRLREALADMLNRYIRFAPEAKEWDSRTTPEWFVEFASLCDTRATLGDSE